MLNGRVSLPAPFNEPVRSYAPDTPERQELKHALSELKGQQLDIPMVIGGREVRTGKTEECRPPHDRSLLLGKAHVGGAAETRQAIEAALEARRAWAETPFEERAAVFLRAAELL